MLARRSAAAPAPAAVTRGDATPITVAPPARRARPPADAADWAARLPRRSPIVVVLATLLLTAAAAAFVAVTGRARDRARFENAVQAATDRIVGRFDTYEALLYGGAALFTASDTVSAADFQAYVTRLDLPDRYPGVQGIGFSRRLAADAAGGEAHAIAHLEPRDARNRAALGYDMFAEPVRRAAMIRARDTGRPAASGAVTLRQEITARKQRGFNVYVPVYRGGTVPATVAERRAALLGFVYSPFRAGDLFAGVFGRERQPRVAFRVFDGADTTGALLADSRELLGTAAGRARPGQPVRVEALDVAGRSWTIAFTPVAPASGGTAVAITIAFVGFTISVALLIVMTAEVRARERAEHSEAVRGRFFAAMSHELRTPINAILGYNDLLLAGIYGPVPDAQRHGVQRSQRAARHLLELVNDVLDLSKLEAGKVEVTPEPVRLDELLDDLFATIRPMAEERGCELRLAREACAVTLHTDPRRVRQILLNLLSNATKFGAGRPVEVRCRPLPRGELVPGTLRQRLAGDGVVVAVTDHGAGIATDDQERIFEEFVQLPGTSAGGTGLGLPISRRLAELLGGSLTVSSAAGRGATFCVTLPVAWSGGQPARPARRAPQRS